MFIIQPFKILQVKNHQHDRVCFSIISIQMRVKLDDDHCTASSAPSRGSTPPSQNTYGDFKNNLDIPISFPIKLADSS